jgi:hypothetical protein
MSSFINAMDEISQRAVGVNGSSVYKVPVGDGEDLLALFGAINRDLDDERLYELLENAMKTATVEDLHVLAFHTRDILEGKGERELFYKMFLYMVHHSKDKGVEMALVKLIPDYGAWFDLQRLVKDGPDGTADKELLDRVLEVYCERLNTEYRGDKQSLAAKWAPREGKSDSWLAKLLARKMFKSTPSKTDCYRKYRKVISSLNAKLDTVERKMCHDDKGEHHFSDINPGKVPSRCLKTKRKAFFDEDKKGAIRHPEDPDRVKCRQNFQAHMEKAVKGEAKVHGKTLMPHEFIVELERAVHFTEDDYKTLQAQWNDLRDSVLAKGTLGKTVVMSDFSGSMTGGGHGNVQPIHVSKGLGLLCAECTSPAFRNRILTFDSTPTWHNVSRYTTLKDRIRSFNGVSQGLSTNFQAAMDLVLTRLVEARVPVGEEPDIILVITDMGWDQANTSHDNSYYGGWGNFGESNKPSGGKFETHIDRIKCDFKTAGGWKMPTIVIWNVSGKFQEYHHKSDTEGVCVISGWSPAILKYIMNGDDIVEKMKTMTPYKMMRHVLDDPRYDPVRDVVKSI